MDTNITYVNAEVLNDELKSVLLPVTVYVGSEAVLGFFGNLLVLFVFTFHYHSCNFRYFVLCLALTDVIACSTAVSGEVVTQTFWYIYPFHQICKAKSFFNVFTVFAEAFCLLTIAVDRYRKVCAPLGWQITPRIAITLCVVIYILSGIIATPVAIFWGTHDRMINRTDIILNEKHYDSVSVNVTVCEIDREYLGQKPPKSYTYSLEVIVSTSLVPMFILYILIAKTLIGSSKSFDKHKRPENNGDLNTKSNGGTKSNEVNIATFNHKKRLPSKASVSQLEDIEMESSTLNSMSTTQTNGTVSSDDSKSNQDKRKSRTQRKNSKIVSTRVRRKTLIMFILTLIFIITTITYLTMLGLIAGDILESLSFSGKAAYFFFFRFYFLNHVINPIVYCLLDPQFKRVMGSVYQKVKTLFSIIC